MSGQGEKQGPHHAGAGGHSFLELVPSLLDKKTGAENPPKFRVLCGLPAPAVSPKSVGLPGALWVRREANLLEEDSKDPRGQSWHLGSGRERKSRDRELPGSGGRWRKVCWSPRRASCLLGNPRSDYQNERHRCLTQDKI